MTKKIPDLLIRFLKIKEKGGLSNPEISAKIVDPLERRLIQKIMDLGD